MARRQKPLERQLETLWASVEILKNGGAGGQGAKGDKGDPGNDGVDGEDGLSAYQVAVANGYQGSQAAWLVSLKGEKGDKGDRGDAGQNGLPGADSTVPGPKGDKGDPGDAGSPGSDGNDGTPGTDGEDGLSAYQVAVANGFVGTEAAWLLSLKGAKGDTGDTGQAGADGTDGWTWAKLGSDQANSTVTLATSGLSFAALANTTYLVQAFITFTSAATTTGIAAALDIPSGSVSGFGLHPISATVPGSFEQIADNATTGTTTAVRAATTNVPMMVFFIVAVGATPGNVTLMFRSEVAGSAVTLKANLTALGRRVI